MLPELLLFLAPLQGPVTLEVTDPVLVTASSDVLEAALGNALHFEVQGPAAGLLFLAYSATPPFGAGSIGGVPLEVDPLTAMYPLLGQALGPAGQHVHVQPIPASLPAGLSIWTQAAVLDPQVGDLLLSNGVRIDLVPPKPGDLPLLEPGHHIGLVYSTPPATAAPAMDAAWGECLAKGVDSYELSLGWSDIEPAPGVYSTMALTNLLNTASGAGLVPYLSVTAIDAGGLTLPSDLVDPLDASRLAPGLTWDSPQLRDRFQQVLDIVTPSLVQSGGFFLSLGSEVDLRLAGDPAQTLDFASFVESARSYVHSTQPLLAVGVSLTFDAAVTAGPLLAALGQAADNLAWTYFPLQPDHTPRDPSVVPFELALLQQAVAPRPLVLQRIGYPSGYQPVPTNGSSEEQQRAFVEAVFDVVLATPKLRFASLVQLGERGPTEAAELAAELGITAPLFLEHLATLGLCTFATGTPKPAYAELLLGLASL
ncbi:MAG: hypothetical protein P1V81_07395 [Planctomycetota bacterium]|nr:hypothetical protein [Planctomycetota bacterium]